MMIDLVAILLIVYGVYLGYTRGIIKTVFSIVSILVGVLAALSFSPMVIRGIQNALNWHPGFVFVLGFALTFIVVLGLVRFFGKKLEDTLELAKINFINKAIGGAVLGMTVLVFYSYILFSVDRLGLLTEKNKENSNSYEFLQTLPASTKVVLDKTKPIFKGFWKQVTVTFDQIKDRDHTTEEKKLS